MWSHEHRHEEKQIYLTLSMHGTNLMRKKQNEENQSCNLLSNVMERQFLLGVCPNIIFGLFCGTSYPMILWGMWYLSFSSHRKKDIENMIFNFSLVRWGKLKSISSHTKVETLHTYILDFGMIYYCIMYFCDSCKFSSASYILDDKNTTPVSAGKKYGFAKFRDISFCGSD